VAGGIAPRPPQETEVWSRPVDGRCRIIPISIVARDSRNAIDMTAHCGSKRKAGPFGIDSIGFACSVDEAEDLHEHEQAQERCNRHQDPKIPANGTQHSLRASRSIGSKGFRSRKLLEVGQNSSAYPPDRGCAER